MHLAWWTPEMQKKIRSHKCDTIKAAARFDLNWKIGNNRYIGNVIHVWIVCLQSNVICCLNMSCPDMITQLMYEPATFTISYHRATYEIAGEPTCWVHGWISCAGFICLNQVGMIISSLVLKTWLTLLIWRNWFWMEF